MLGNGNETMKSDCIVRIFCVLEVEGAELDGLVIDLHAMPHSSLSTKTTHISSRILAMCRVRSHLCTYRDFLSQTALDLGNVQV